MKKILFILFCFPLITSAQEPKTFFGKKVFDGAVFFNPVNIPYVSSVKGVHLYIDTVSGSSTYGQIVRQTAGGGVGVTDGDKGDITVSSTGTVWTIDNGVVSNAKLSNSTISGIALGSNLADLTATDGTLTFSGTYTGATARTIGINLSNANTWAADQSVPDEAYNATNWNASVEVPTKNALRDQMELYQLLSNLSIDVDLGVSNTLYPSQFAVKTYVDNTALTIALKEAVIAATEVAGTLATSFENGDAIDGITLATGNRILLKNQAAAEENGIYTVNASGAPTRAVDFDQVGEIPVGAETFIQTGTINGGRKYTQTLVVTTLNTDPIAFLQTGGASGTAWGAITGTLTDQTDLDNALDLKATLASPTFTGTVVLPSSTVTNAMLAGSIDLTTKVTGVLPAANGGTGVNNSTRTLTVNTNSGTIAFSSASKTLTVDESITLNGTDATTMTFPTTSATIARTDAAQTFTGIQTLSSAPVLSSNTLTANGNLMTFPGSAQTLAGLTDTKTFTNTRITMRSGTVPSSATPTINTDNVDLFTITALTVAITSMTTNLSGTPVEGDYLEIWITGTAARAITWGASFGDGTAALPTTTVGTTPMMVLLQRKGSLWICKAAGSSTN